MEGSAYGPGNKPLAGGTIYLNRHAEEGEWYNQARTADARGRYRFDALPGGIYEISASSFESQGFEVIFQAESNQRQIIVREGETTKADITVSE